MRFMALGIHMRLMEQFNEKTTNLRVFEINIKKTFGANTCRYSITLIDIMPIMINKNNNS